MESEAAGGVQLVRAGNVQHVNGGSALFGNAEGALAEPVVSSCPAPGSLGEYEKIAPRGQETSHALHLPDHDGGEVPCRGGGDVSRGLDLPAEKRNLEERVLDDGFVPFEQGDQQQWIEVGAVVADNDG